MYISLHKTEKISLWRSPEAGATLLATLEIKTLQLAEMISYLLMQKKVCLNIFGRVHILYFCTPGLLASMYGLIFNFLTKG